jgi:hypothetical protein
MMMCSEETNMTGVGRIVEFADEQWRKGMVEFTGLQLPLDAILLLDDPLIRMHLPVPYTSQGEA